MNIFFLKTEGPTGEYDKAVIAALSEVAACALYRGLFTGPDSPAENIICEQIGVGLEGLQPGVIVVHCD